MWRQSQIIENNERKSIIIIIIISILSKSDEATAVFNHNFAFPGYRSEYLLCGVVFLFFKFQVAGQNISTNVTFILYYLKHHCPFP